MFPLANLARSEGDPKILAAGPSAVPLADRMARGLGWFSLALGVAELVAPHWLTRPLGLRGREGLIRAFGLREIAAGILTLSTERRAGIASRIIGDGLDFALLATALGPGNRRRDNAATALVLVAGIALLDIAASKALETAHGRRGQPRSYADRSGFPRRRPDQAHGSEWPADEGEAASIGAGAEPSPGSGPAPGESVAPVEPDADGGQGGSAEPSRSDGEKAAPQGNG